MPNKVLAIVNATGRQAASVARVASAVGYMLPSHHLLTHHPVRHPEDSEAKLRSSYQVRAHVSKRVPPAVAHELDALDNVTIIEGSLEDKQLVADLFAGAHKAFVNTVAWGDEVAIGKSLADAAKKAHVQHYVYSSMPDHSIYGKGWPAVPGWSCKFTVENYIRQIGLSATFVYTGIYNNNFTSTPMPLFRMELRPDGSFQWKAPFHPDTLLPWLDAEHDVGPLVIQVFKDGPGKWIGHR